MGSGPILGTARESQRKVQELTNGQVVCNDHYVHQYEIDLVKAINQGEKGMFQMGISESKEVSFALNLQIVLSEDQKKIDEEFLSVCHVLPAQLLGFYKSLDLGLRPDMPSVSQAITRVVQGVAIYPFPSSNKIKETTNAGRDENTRRHGGR